MIKLIRISVAIGGISLIVLGVKHFLATPPDPGSGFLFVFSGVAFILLSIYHLD